MDYQRHRERLTEEGAHQVKWEVLAKALEEESPNFCLQVTKHVTGVCGVGKWLEQWK
jgi:hypothetical protein